MPDHAATPVVTVLLCHDLRKNMRMRSQRNPWKWMLIFGHVYSACPTSSCWALLRKDRSH
uniref:Uncharacterized protein n=1 Tax=Arundo donax TaxID=35708 RepID=A0A0A9CRF1_ARUDO